MTKPEKVTLGKKAGKLTLDDMVEFAHSVGMTVSFSLEPCEYKFRKKQKPKN